ncbi:type II toxin-antitoxin system VapC family toxin [Leptolyngbya ohadii]|uniref:type II toxin-antitoxin system VapC family toxin n=1 Tax=Leptolyngbya ohadii TaxID=1962290 RepID=UPI000B59CFF2|nr:VapC toxin family PIN domain ribonuclease [Leptolyngbya ohadii]
MSRLILDAGPLIALFHNKDVDHEQCLRGFTQLSQASTSLLVPTSIVYEVYKWLLQRTNPSKAKQALQIMEESLHFLMLNQDEFQGLCNTVQKLSGWQGTLEDLTVIETALRYRCPVWTLNYRDFAAFSQLEFWNPEG